MKAIALLLLSFMFFGCSSDNDDNGNNNGNGNTEKATLQEVATGKPEWSKELSTNLGDNEDKPNWQAPDPSLYENWMIFMMRIQEDLKPFLSDDDMMALFVGGELRAVSHPAKPADGQVQAGDESTYFILRVLGNEDPSQEVEATLKLWLSQLHQTFTVKGRGYFIPEKVVGVDSEYLPDLMLGSSKYPVTSWMKFNFSPEDYGLQRSEEDLMAAFIGNECRGLTRVFDNAHSELLRIVVFSKQEGEEARLLYYNATANRVYETGITFKTVAENATLSL